MVAEAVRGPNTAIAVRPVDRVDEPKALRLPRILARVVRIAQQPRGHARPESEDDKGQQIAHGHGPSPFFKDGGPKRRRELPPTVEHCFSTVLFLNLVPWLRRRDVVQDDEEEDRARDVDKGIRAVRPPHEGRVLEEPLLHGRFDEDAEALLDMDDLEGVLSRGVDRRCLQRHGGEGASELVDLWKYEQGWVQDRRGR